MKKLQVVGPGCPKCEELAKRTEEVAKALGVDYELEKVKDLNQIMSLGVFMTPALVVDGQVKVVGKVPSEEEIKKMIQ
jgi:small redox-active disulfide protein 2